MDEGFAAAVAAAVAGLRRGEVASYGEIAEEAGYPGRARAVGKLLATWDGEPLPWWRVVRADGSLVAPAGDQAERLAREGVVIIAGRVRPPRSASPARNS